MGVTSLGPHIRLACTQALLEIRPIKLCELCGSNYYVVCSFSHGVTWYKSRPLIGPWGQGQTFWGHALFPRRSCDLFYANSMQISHVIPFSRSDWLRAKFAAL